MNAMKRNVNNSSNESERLLRSEVLIGSWTVPLVEDRQRDDDIALHFRGAKEYDLKTFS